MAPRNSESSHDWQVQYPEIKMRSAHLLRSREWADCTFQFQFQRDGAGSSKDTLDAHKLILSMASPVFAAMFYGDFGDKEGPVPISDIDMPTFSAMLNYIYTDEIDLCGMNTHTAAKLYGAANKYILIHLEKICLDYLFHNLNHHNVCYIYEFSCLYSQDELKEKCLQLFSTKTVDVLKGRSFRNAQVETLKKIVSMDSLNINSEMDLFNAVVDYADNNKCLIDNQNDEELSKTADDQQIPNGDSDSRTSRATALQPSSKRRKVEARCYLQGVLQQIRFLCMSTADLAENCEISALLTKDEMLALFANLSSTKACMPLPDGFSTSREQRNQRFRPTPVGETKPTTVEETKPTTVEETKPRKPTNSEKNLNIAELMRTISQAFDSDLRSRTSEGMFQHKVYNFRRMTQVRTSLRYNIGGLNWYSQIKPHQEPNKRKMLGVYVNCDGLDAGYSCTASVELRLLSNDNAPKVYKLREIFDNSHGWGTELIEWREIKNPVNGFMDGDTITVEVHIKADPPAPTSSLSRLT